MEAETEDVLDWFLALSPENRRTLLRSPADLPPKRVEKRAEMEEWIDRLTVDDGRRRGYLAAVGEGFDELESVVDEVDLHLRRIKLDRLSEDIRSLRWDSLGR